MSDKESKSTSFVMDFVRGFLVVLAGALVAGMVILLLISWVTGRFEFENALLITLGGAFFVLVFGGAELALSLLFQYDRPMNIKFVEFLGGAAAGCHCLGDRAFRFRMVSTGRARMRHDI